MRYITEGMGAACSPCQTIHPHTQHTWPPLFPPAARHPSPSSFLWPQLSFHPLLHFILSPPHPPPLSPAHHHHHRLLSNCYRSDLAGSSLSLHPGCFLLRFSLVEMQQKRLEKERDGIIFTHIPLCFFFCFFSLRPSSSSSSSFSVTQSASPSHVTLILANLASFTWNGCWAQLFSMCWNWIYSFFSIC